MDRSAIPKAPGAQYRTSNGGWLFGYRHLSVEVKTGDSKTELTLSGPALGYGFSF
jgi:hypothetical protein